MNPLIIGALAGLVTQVAKHFFPQLAPDKLISAGVSLLDPNVVKFAQQACNRILQPSPNLVVDGIWGPKTQAAVTQLQKQLGVNPDGWFGPLTEAAVRALPAATTGL